MKNPPLRPPCLITGGAGFVGSHLTRALVAGGHPVTVLDNLSNGDLAHIADIRSRIRFLKGDVRDAAAVKRAMQGNAVVFHLAAMVSVQESLDNPKEAYAINAEATRLLLEEAARQRISRVVYASSCAVYGDAGKKHISEKTPARPMSPYALSKWLGERYAVVYNAAYGIETASLRFFNVYGPGQRADSPYAAVIPRFIEAVLSGKSPVVFGDGLQTRDFVYVGDVVDALRRAAIAPRAAGTVVNVAGGKAVTLRELLKTIAALTNTKSNPRFAKARAGDILHSRADVRAAKRVLGFRAKTPLKRGLAETIRWYRKNL